MSYNPAQATPSDTPNLIRYLFRELQRVGREFYAISPQEWQDVVFEANWGNLGSTVHDAQYRAVGNDIELRGRAIDTGAAVLDSVIFYLPDTARPIAEVQFPVAANNLFGKLTVGTGGDVRLQIGSVIWVQLDGIRFSLN